VIDYRGVDSVKIGWLLMALVLVFGGCPNGSVKEEAVHRGARDVRCVSLVPSITEIIYALNAQALLLGTTNQCDYPAEAKMVYKVGDFQTPDLERIVALKPTVVFATVPMHARLIEKLKEMKIRVYISEPVDIASVFTEIESVGAILKREERTRHLVDSLRQWLSMLPVFADTPRVYIEISAIPLMSVGSGVFINDLIRQAGGVNIFEDVKQPYPIVESEAVVKRNPAVILILHPGASAQDVRERVGWQDVIAVQKGRVFDGLDEDLFSRPGPRVVEGIYLLARILHSR